MTIDASIFILPWEGGQGGRGYGERGGGKRGRGGGKWGERGREAGREGEGSGERGGGEREGEGSKERGEGSGDRGGGKRGERGREAGIGYPTVHPHYHECGHRHTHDVRRINVKLSFVKCGENWGFRFKTFV